MSEARYQIHWTAGLASVNPKRILDQQAVITSACYSENPMHGLILTLKLREKNLEGRLLITSSDPFDVMNEEEFRLAAKKAVSDLYDSFEVTSYDKLVGKNVLAKVFENSIVGVQREL